MASTAARFCSQTAASPEEYSAIDFTISPCQGSPFLGVVLFWTPHMQSDGQVAKASAVHSTCLLAADERGLLRRSRQATLMKAS